ncbi:MAG: hypothetical protein JOZ65_23800 [Chloroflexi bacterium]|nr:hypothetical protein [Chloroflexota bacterium]
MAHPLRPDAPERVHRAFARWLLAVSVLAASLVASSSASAQAASFCDAGQAPAFEFGFADLKYALGYIMGDPLECEHPNSANGDTLQQTTTGLAIYRQATNTPEFTDGWNHWALMDQGLTAWTDAEQPAAGTPALAQAGNANQCVDVGAGLCLNAATDLAGTVTLLDKTTAAPPLLRAAARDGYRVYYGNLPTDVLGLFRPSRHEVILSLDLRSYPDEDRVPVLAHELQHVSDWITLGQQLETTSGCLQTETNAFHTQSQTWLELHDGTLAPPRNDLEREFNTITRAIQTDPAAFASRLTLLYHDECTGQ